MFITQLPTSHSQNKTFLMKFFREHNVGNGGIIAIYKRENWSKIGEISSLISHCHSMAAILQREKFRQKIIEKYIKYINTTSLSMHFYE